MSWKLFVDLIRACLHDNLDICSIRKGIASIRRSSEVGKVRRPPTKGGDDEKGSDGEGAEEEKAWWEVRQRLDYHDGMLWKSKKRPRETTREHMKGAKDWVQKG